MAAHLRLAIVSSDILLKKFRNEVELTPVPGSNHLHKIQPVFSRQPLEENAQMTEADWDKFEEDIHQAFEQLP